MHKNITVIVPTLAPSQELEALLGQIRAFGFDFIVVQARDAGSTITVDRGLPDRNILCCRWSHDDVDRVTPHKFDIVLLIQQNDF